MPEKNKNSKFRYYRLALWVFASLFMLFITIGLILIFSAERIINNNLSDIIYQKSDSIYRLEFEEMSLELKTRTLVFNNIALKPDPKTSSNGSKSFYEFETNSLTISGIKIRELLKYKKIHAQSLKVSNPGFKLSTGQDVDINTFNAQKIEKGDSLKLPFVNEILIDTILITDARLKVDTLTDLQRKTTKVNLEILQFKLGGIKQTDSPFPFDVADISLKIENLQGNLSDQIHVLSVDELSFSILHSRIKAKNVLLEPYTNHLLTLDNQYRIKVPEIEISSRRVENFYQTDTIPIETFTLLSPSIEIKFGKRVRVGTPINEINLYKLIEKNLKWVNIELFSIRNAEIKFYPANSDSIAQHFESLNIEFTQFRIDSASYRDKDRILSARELSFSLDRFTLNHTDKVHQLVINNLTANTENKNISTGVITFRPVNPSNKLIKTINTLIDVECKGASFNGVKFNQMYHNQLLPMDELIIRSPEANISFEKVNFNKKSDKDISLILQKTSDYIKGVYVKKTTITDGVLAYNYILGEDENGFFRTKFQFELKGLSLDSLTFFQSEKIFFADNFKVRFTDIGLQLADNFHRLNTDSVIISSTGKTADIFNFRLLPIKTLTQGDSIFISGQPEIFDIHFPIIQMEGIDLHKAFYEKELSISDIHVLNPVFNIDLLGKWEMDDSLTTGFKTDPYSFISDYLFKINIGAVNLDNGHLNLSQHRKGRSTIEWSNAFSIKMYNFDIDSLSSHKKNKLFFSDNIDLILKKYSFTLADGVHKVFADEIGILSTENRIYVANAKMSPDVQSANFKKLPVTAFATIPFAEFSGANISGIFNEGNFNVKTITFTDPKIRLLFQPDVQPETSSTQSLQFTLKGLKSFTGDKIYIRNGSLELCNYKNLKIKTFGTTTVDLTMNNFRVENEKQLFKTKYGDFIFSLKNTQFDFPDKIHNLTIEKTNYQSSNGLLKITDFKIQPGKEATGNLEREYYNLSFPDLTLNNFNIIDFLENKTIISSLLTVNNPTFEIKGSGKGKKQSFNPYRIKLYSSIKESIEKIDIAQILVNNASVDLNSSKPLHLKQINLSGKSFLVDKNSDTSEKLLLCKSLSVELNHLNGKTKGGYYNYGIEKITLNEQGRFTLVGMSLIPAYSEAEFNRKKVYQEDYVTITRADCLGQGFDLKRFFEKNEIAIGKSNFTFDKVEIYRNNHCPASPNLTIKMPQTELRDLNQKFIADSIFIHCNRFSYREFEPQATTETKLFFTDLNSTISNMTNIRQYLKNDPDAHLQIGAKLMGKGEMNVKLDLNILSDKNKFRVEAECGPMSLQLMNPVTEPSMKLSIKEGFNNKLTTYFEADEDTSSGFMKFSYSDLKISVLNDKDGSMNEDKFISFIANTFAVKSDNPRQGKDLIPVNVKARHDKQRSFVNYCWVSVFSGIKNTFGLKEKEE